MSKLAVLDTFYWEVGKKVVFTRIVWLRRVRRKS